ncbi:hypothetical protein A6A25_34485 [Saccharothrix sp. CB00851]|nr:hypothetical protein [Saccharothrix sp. CB00851]OKI24715.1 hypothetical protein A6A25_34485 [Saccharothrix sp. CB00851]
MTTLPRRIRARSGRESVPALVAVIKTAAGAVRTASPQASSGMRSPGPVVGSLCTGHGGLDLGGLAALGGRRVAWVADLDPHITQILAARMPGSPNLGDTRTIDWTTIDPVEPVEVLPAGFPVSMSSLVREVGYQNARPGSSITSSSAAGEVWAGYVLQQVPSGVAVGPVQPPAGAVVAQLRDRSSGPLGSEVFSPRCADFQDRHV